MRGYMSDVEERWDGILLDRHDFCLVWAVRKEDLLGQIS
jgi:hypothetical protein